MNVGQSYTHRLESVRMDSLVASSTNSSRQRPHDGKTRASQSKPCWTRGTEAMTNRSQEIDLTHNRIGN
jgi:hypothetical protein